MTNRVHILNENTSNQIAAGEVVERPAAAVKELVENALDAGARRIVIELEDGGKSLIRVSDDGCGMNQEDAILALQRHATSKITDADDLFRITTMGFRGEALPSIASVSQTTITTREIGAEAAVGVELRCIGGNLESVQEVGAPPGTTITVENLFFNVPARLKFLKSAQSEFGHILEWVQRIALARPDVSFRVLRQNQESWAAPGSGSLLDACVHVFGRDTARHLLPLSFSSSGITLTGFVSSPSALKPNRNSQHAFVNRRFVRNKAVTRALDDAYKSVQTIHGSRYPAAALLIEIDPSQVDVNVSPTKTEVRFTRESEIYSAVFHAVQNALMAGGLVATVLDKAVTPDTFATASQSSVLDKPLFSIPSRLTANTHADIREFREAVQERAGLNVGIDPFEDTPMDSASIPTKVQPSPATSTSGADYRGQSMGSIEVLAQTRNRYILAQTEHALVLIDQHIAHERILYERFAAAAKVGGSAVAVQHLALPLTLQLEKRAAMVVEQRLIELQRAGFELEPFGGDSFVVRTIPASLAQSHIKAQEGAEATLREIIDEMTEKTVSRRLLLPADEVLISASCKMAVKAGDPLSFEEMQTLVDDLMQCDNPYTCPHGRPILIELSHHDLDKKFGR